MGFYEARVFPWACDLVLGTREVAALRTDLLARARGDVVEIGFGSGLNVPAYPEGVRRLVAVEPSEGMRRRAASRLAAARFPVELVALAGERLPLADRTFDTAATTFTLCSVADPPRVLAELHRVLRDDGVLLVAEHGRSPRPFMAGLQRALTPLNRVVACGCHLDRPMRQLVEAAGFRFTSLEDARWSHLPGPFSWLTVGAARKA